MIAALPKSTALKISSGQLVPDLCSIVKELLENAIDSKADSIEIRFTEYGFSGVEVIDNGCGILESDFNSLGKKHYTSKITTFEELQKEYTIGFRGEGLHSIMSMSDLTFVTATKANAPMGFTVNFEGANSIGPVTRCARERGTTVKVKNMFKCFPVRKKEFEKNKAREFQKSVVLLEEYSLIFLNIQFKVIHKFSSNKPPIVIFCTKGDGSVGSCISSVLNINPKKISGQVKLDLNKSKGDLTVIYSSTRSASSGSSRIFLFANNRPIIHSKISRAIKEQFVAARIFPEIIYLAINLESGLIDFNCDPGKRRVEFRFEEDILSSINENILPEIEKSSELSEVTTIEIKQAKTSQVENSVPEVRNKRKNALNNSTDTYQTFNDTMEVDDEPFFKNLRHFKRVKYVPIPSGKSLDLRILKKSEFKDMIVIGQFNLGFIICMDRNICGISSLYIVDQHAADEKYNFEKLQLNFEIPTQKLISAKNLNLDPSTELSILSKIEILKKYGIYLMYDNSASSGHRLKVLALPSLKQFSLAENSIEDLLRSISNSDVVPLEVLKRFSMYFASKACRMSVMIGTALNRSQMQNILINLSYIEQPWNCPHGRPTIRHLVDIETQLILQSEIN